MSLQPTTPEELSAIIKETQVPLVPRGGGSKPTLSRPHAGSQALDMSQLSGILAYDPGEYTFTAYAATPIAEIANTLATHGQYLPYDPLLVDRGATLGGVVAANTSGSGRYRYGGVRDFILWIGFVDGNGRYAHSGSKVVKNSAGFDLPKFMVGSLGAFGLLVELTFKVFPRPQFTNTMAFTYASLPDVMAALYHLATTPFEMDALDLELGPENQFRLIVRLGGLPQAVPGRIARLQKFLEAETAVAHCEKFAAEDDPPYWSAVNNFQHGHGFEWAVAGSNLIKVPLTPKQIPLLEQKMQTCHRRYTVGGNVAWLADVDVAHCDRVLTDLGLIGLQLFGSGSQLYLGQQKGLILARRIKKALDPAGKLREI